MKNLEELSEHFNPDKHFLGHYWKSLYKYLDDNWKGMPGESLNHSYSPPLTYTNLEFSIPELSIFEYDEIKNDSKYKIIYNTVYMTYPLTIYGLNSMKGYLDFINQMLHRATEWKRSLGYYLMKELINKMTFEPYKIGIVYERNNLKENSLATSITLGTIDVPIFPTKSVSLVRWRI